MFCRVRCPQLVDITAVVAPSIVQPETTPLIVMLCVAAAPVEQNSDTPPLQKINLTEYPIGFVHFTNHIQSRFGKNSIAHSEYIFHWPESPVIEIDHPPA